MSDDGSLLAYSTDDTGFRQYTLFVKDLRTGEVAGDGRGEGGLGGLGRGQPDPLLHGRGGATKRQYRLYRHGSGEPRARPRLRGGGRAPSTSASTARAAASTSSSASGSLTTTEARFLPAAEPLGEWRLVAPRAPEHEYDVDHHGDVFYIRDQRHRAELPPRDGAGGEPRARELERGRAPPRRRDAGGRRLLPRPPRALRARGRPAPGPGHRPAQRRRPPHRLPGAGLLGVARRPTPSSTRGPSATPTSRSSRPRSVFDYDMETRAATLLKQQPVLGGYDRAATPPSGSVRDRPRRGDGAGLARLPEGAREGRLRAALLYGYGSYGFPLPVTFSSNRREPPRPRRRRGHRPRPRRRRAGQALARRGADAAEDEHLHRLHRRRRAPAARGGTASRDRLVDRGRQRRRPADGRGDQPAARPVQGGGVEGPLRRRHQHDARRDAAAHGGRVRGVGQPEGEGGVRLHQVATARTRTSSARPTRRCS